MNFCQEGLIHHWGIENKSMHLWIWKMHSLPFKLLSCPTSWRCWPEKYSWSLYPLSRAQNWEMFFVTFPDDVRVNSDHNFVIATSVVVASQSSCVGCICDHIDQCQVLLSIHHNILYAAGQRAISMTPYQYYRSTLILLCCLGGLVFPWNPSSSVVVKAEIFNTNLKSFFCSGSTQIIYPEEISDNHPNCLVGQVSIAT